MLAFLPAACSRTCRFFFHSVYVIGICILYKLNIVLPVKGILFVLNQRMVIIFNSSSLTKEK
jgi:hypothetical protein